jgi:MerR family redox-sensitive transcriptional activator SoxR
MKIGELASRTGVNSSALRYYEQCGLLAPPYRTSGQRRYSEDVVSRVLLIRFASDMGFSLAEIRVFLNGLRDKTPVGARWRKLACRKIKEVDATIKRSNRLKALLEHLLECQCGSLQLCVQRLRLSPALSLISDRSNQRRLQSRAQILGAHSVP